MKKISWEPIIAAIAGGLVTGLVVTLGAYYLIVPQVVTDANMKQAVSTYADFAEAFALSASEPEAAATDVAAGRMRIAIYGNRKVIDALGDALVPPPGNIKSVLPRVVHQIRAHIGAEEVTEDSLKRLLFP